MVTRRRMLMVPPVAAAAAAAVVGARDAGARRQIPAPTRWPQSCKSSTPDLQHPRRRVTWRRSASLRQ